MQLEASGLDKASDCFYELSPDDDEAGADKILIY